MAYAAIGYPYNGNFTNTETGHAFDYEDYVAENHIPPVVTSRGLRHANAKIYVGPYGVETRYAVVLKTVAYVIVDELDNGEWAVEKWQIKDHVRYQKG